MQYAKNICMCYSTGGYFSILYCSGFSYFKTVHSLSPLNKINACTMSSFINANMYLVHMEKHLQCIYIFSVFRTKNQNLTEIFPACSGIFPENENNNTKKERKLIFLHTN